MPTASVCKMSGRAGRRRTTGWLFFRLEASLAPEISSFIRSMPSAYYRWTRASFKLHAMAEPSEISHRGLICLRSGQFHPSLHRLARAMEPMSIASRRAQSARSVCKTAIASLSAREAPSSSTRGVSLGYGKPHEFIFPLGPSDQSTVSSKSNAVVD